MAAPPIDKSAEEQWQQNINEVLICPECKVFPPNLIEEYSAGDMVCADCGMVLGARIVDNHSEWRTFNNDDQNNDDPSRVGDGPNLLLNGDQLQTSISLGDGGKVARELNRAQNKTSQDKGNKSLMNAYKQIGAICDTMHLPGTVTNYAKFLYKEVNDAGAFRGKPLEVVVAGIIFISCRQLGVGRTFREIFAYTNVPKKEIGRVFKLLDSWFQKRNDKLTAAADEVNATSATGPAELCIRFCSRLNLGAEITRKVELLAEKIDKVGALAGRSPLSAAAACIYFVSHVMKSSRSAKEIAGVVGVSDGTIRTSYKLLWDKKDELVDADWLKDGKADMNELPKP